MIFGNAFDKSLWLMLKTDKKNRDRIIGFVRSIPEPLLVKLRENIELYKKLDEDTNSNNSELLLYDEYETQDRILYWYNFDNIFGTLELGYSVFTGLKYEGVFALFLESDELSKNNKNQCIGCTEYDVVESEDMFTCSATEFSLLKTFLGTFVMSDIDEKNNKDRVKIRIVNINNIPDEMFISDFDNRDVTNRLVRRKKK